MQQLLKLTEFLAPYGTHAYFFMLAILLACGFGLPMPEDIVLISGGILASRGICDLYWTNVACLVGVLLGDGIVFMLGRNFGERIKRTWPFRKILNEKTEKKAKDFFERYGDKVIFMARFMPGLRMPIFMSAGIYRVKSWKFFALDGFAAIISVPIWVHAGFFFGANLEVLEKRIKQLQFGLYLILGIILVLVVSYIFLKRRLLNKELSRT